MLWNTKVTPNAQFLGWRISLDKLPTKDNLIVRGVQLQHNLCELCQASAESADHLFSSCRVAQKVWNLCDNWLEVSSVHHFKAKENFKHFSIINLNTRQNSIWRGMWLAIVEEIWKHRNGVIRKVDPDEIFGLTQVTVWVWMKHKIPSVNFSYSDWVFHLSHA